MPINKGVLEDTTYNHTTKGAKEKSNKREILASSGGLRPRQQSINNIRQTDMAHSRQYTKIMNSQRWHNLQSEILRAKPYCERCEAKGWRIPSKVVHHIKPIESGHSMDEYERLAYDPENLQALCHQCHADIHSKELGSFSKAGRIRRQNDRNLRWGNDLMKKFMKADIERTDTNQ